MNKPIIIFNLETNGMREFNSCRQAAKFLKRHHSTVARALSGDRNKLTVANHLILPA